MTLLRKKRVLAAKVETTPGTAESLTASEAAFNIYNAEMQANIETIERMSQASFSQQSSIAGPRGGTCTFTTYLEGDGAGGVPAWASTFLPACGYVVSTGTFSPTTEAPGSNVKTITIGLYEDGLKKTLAGCAGNCVITFPAGRLIQFDWTFTGVWQAPADVAILAPTYPTVRPLRWASSTYTLGAASIGTTGQVTIDLGNEVVLRPTGTTASGYAHALITGRKTTGTMDPESRLVATESVWSEWLSGTEQALSLAVDDGTDEITFAAPKLQRNNIQEGDREGVQVDQMTFQCNKSAAAGDDEFTIDFAAVV